MAKRQAITVEYFIGESPPFKGKACVRSSLQFGESSAKAGVDPLPSVLQSDQLDFVRRGNDERLKQASFSWAANVVVSVRSFEGGDVEIHWAPDSDDCGRSDDGADAADDGSCVGSHWVYRPYVPPPHCVMTRRQLMDILADWDEFVATREPFTATYQPGY